MQMYLNVMAFLPWYIDECVLTAPNSKATEDDKTYPNRLCAFDGLRADVIHMYTPNGTPFSEDTVAT